MTIQSVPLFLRKTFSFFCFAEKIFKSHSRPANCTSARAAAADGDGKRHGACCLCEAMLWHTLYPDTHMQPTSLSWAFDLLRNMSRTFRGQIARHKQRKCNANKPFSRCSCALWSNAFLLFACFFFPLWPLTHFRAAAAAADEWGRELLTNTCRRAARVGDEAFWGQSGRWAHQRD